MKKLAISPDVSFPPDAQTRTLIVFGGKGKGKTNFGSVLCEEFAAAGLRFCVVDPLDVWWGLRHGPDRQTEGIPIVILGGTHGDIPIDPTGGQVAADFVADEPANTVIVMRKPSGEMWTSGERIRFMRDFARALFRRQGEDRKPVHLVIDEAGRFVPQMAQRGDLDIADCIGAIEELVEWGRNVGIGVTLITQRSARMNKSVTELAECLVAFQTVGPNSVDAVMAWFGEHIAKERHRELSAALRKLPVGRALVISPEWLDFEGEAKIRQRRTFDSSATPKPGATLRPGKARAIDLDRYRARMEETRAKAIANDPKTLTARIKALEAQIAQRAKVSAVAGDDKAVAKATGALERAHALKVKAMQKELDQAAKRVQDMLRKFGASMEDITAGFRQFSESMAKLSAKFLDPAFTGVNPNPVWTGEERPRQAEPALRPGDRLLVKGQTNTPDHVARVGRAIARQTMSDLASTDAERNGDRGPLGEGALKILGAIVQAGRVMTMDEIAVLTGYKKSSRSEYIRRLIAHGFIERSGAGWEPTDAGVAAAGDLEPLPTGGELLDHWRAKLSEGERRILDAAVAHHPGAIAFDSLKESTGYQKSSVSEYIRRLVARRLLFRNGQGYYRAADDLFDAD